MAKLTASQREGFAALRRVYLAQVPGRIAEIRREAAALRPGSAAREALLELRQLAHRLVGSSALFGLPLLSAAARDLEQELDRVLAGAASPGGLAPPPAGAGGGGGRGRGGRAGGRR